MKPGAVESVAGGERKVWRKVGVPEGRSKKQMYDPGLPGFAQKLLGLSALDLEKREPSLRHRRD